MRIIPVLFFLLLSLVSAKSGAQDIGLSEVYVDSLRDDVGVDSLTSFGYAQSAVNLSKGLEGDERIPLIYSISEALRSKKFYGKASEYAAYGIDLSLELSMPEMQGKGVLLQGKIERGLGRFKVSNASCQKALKLLPSEKASEASAEANLLISRNYRDVHSYDEAMTFAVNALVMYETLGDSLGIGSALGQMGNINVFNRNFEEAKSFFTQENEIALALHDSSAMLNSFHHLGLYHQKVRNYDMAISVYESAYEMAIALGYYQRAAILSGNIGSSYADQGQDEVGLPYLEQALSLKRMHGSPVGSVCHTLLDLSAVYRGLGDYSLAVDYANEVITLSTARNDVRDLMWGSYHLAMAKRLNGDYEAANVLLLDYLQLRDSMFNADKVQQIQELQIAYESDKKDGAIASLELVNEVQKSHNQRYLILVIALLVIGFILFLLQRLMVKNARVLREKEKEVELLKSNFFANVSHEFRTPLTLILGPIQSRLTKVTEPKEQEELRMMERNAFRLQRLINDILDLSKFEAGKLELQASSLNITELINGVAGTFASLADSKKITYQINVDGDTAGVLDKHKLETILINLLSNAFKYTPQGGNVGIAAKVAEGVLHVSVKDTGKGIPEDKQAQIFERFYQVDDAEGRKAEGTGIGLAFTRELVEMHGGHIKVESTLGLGSIFTFSIPYYPEKYAGAFVEELKGVSVVSAAVDAQIEPVEVDSNLPLVLLVEDNADVRTYIHSILSESYQVAFGINGQEGLDKALELIPDLIISDVMMPIMDGFELCEAVKSNELTAHIPLILLTAKSSSESRIKGLETEADVYMAKPFNPEELRLQVRNLLKLKERMRERYQSDLNQVIPISVEGNSMEQQFLDKLEGVMLSNYQNSEFNAELMCAAMDMSRSQLHRKLKALTSDSTTRFIRTYRLKIAYQKLQLGTNSISAIAYDVGFNNVSYFNKCFKEAFGKQPSEITV